MEKKIVITYNLITKDLEVKENEFTTFEALGILEAVKALIQNNWLNN